MTKQDPPCLNFFVFFLFREDCIWRILEIFQNLSDIGEASGCNIVIAAFQKMGVAHDSRTQNSTQ